MIVGVPKEIKASENRVAVTPAGVFALVKAGHTVVIEKGAGEGSGFADQDYRAVGARISPDAAGVFAEAEMIIKVKEPLPPEYALLRQGQIIFCYLHLAPDPAQTGALLERKVVGIAYETIQAADGSLPLLKPMSEIAGKLSVQIGAHCLGKNYGGKGVLLGGVPGVPKGHVAVIGGGTVGTSALKIAVGMGADVTVLDISLERLRYLDDIFGDRIRTLYCNSYHLASIVAEADLVIGAVLIPGAKAPTLVSEEMVKHMSAGSVIVDVAIDQGGCVETIDRITTHNEPVYLRHDVVHYCVPNIPAAVPRTSTLALTNATLPYALELANKGWQKAVTENPSLAKGVNVLEGALTCDEVAAAQGLKSVPLSQFL
ncbi:MAG: alanine dehydrogenase [Bacillota bacterium]